MRGRSRRRGAAARRGPAGCPALPARRSGTGRSSTHLDGARAVDLDAALDDAVRRTRASPAGSGCGSAGIPASPGSGRPSNPGESLPALLAGWSSMTHRSALEAPRHRQRLPRHRRRRTSTRPTRAPSRSATATAASAPTACIALGPGDDGADCTMTLFNADGGRRRDERQRDPLPGVGRAPAGLGDGKRLVVDTGGGRRDGRARSSTADGEVVAATVDMGPVTFDPAAIPLDAPSRSTSRPSTTASPTAATPPGWATRTSCCSSTTRRRRASRSTARASSTTPASRTAPTSSSSRVDRATTRSRCGSGNGAWGRRCRAAPARARPPRSPTGAASSATRVTVHVPGGDLTVELGDTIRLGGPVVHVFDVDVERRREPSRRAPRRARAGRQRRRLTATEVDLEVVRQRALLVGTGFGTRDARRGRGEPRRARAPHRHRGRRAGRRRAPAARPPRSRHLRRLGQGRGAARARRGARRRRRDLRRRAHARAAAQPREDVRARRRRPGRADPRHLRPARHQPGGHDAGRARAAALPPARACAAAATS